jgi:hypothetical protein
MLNKYGPMTLLCMAPFIGMAIHTEWVGFVIIMAVFFYVG